MTLSLVPARIMKPVAILVQGETSFSVVYGPSDWPSHCERVWYFEQDA